MKHSDITPLGDAAGTSRPSRGAWIETIDDVLEGLGERFHRRALRGARGLKQGKIADYPRKIGMKRRALRGARGLKRCEKPARRQVSCNTCRALRGARGLKRVDLDVSRNPDSYLSRALRGARGLKL